MIGAETILTDNPLTAELVEEAVYAVQKVIAPRESSLRGTPDYKRAMVGVMLKDGIVELMGGDSFYV